MTKHLAKTKAGPKTARRSVTIRDVSAELGLSITTISRALNGYPDVGEATRRRVSEAAARLGYRPNRNAQRLVTQRSNSIAWVQSDNDQKLVDPHFVEVMAGVLRGARAANYDVVLTGDTPENQLAVYDRYVKDNSVDGFIVDLPMPNDPRIEFLLKAERPFAVHGRGPDYQRYGWVDVDNFGNFYKLTQLLIANGHRHIALINGDEHYLFAGARRRGVEAALADLDLPADTVRIYNTVHPMGETGFQLTTTALKDTEVTALIYSSALMVVEGNSALMRAGRRIGEDIAVASMDDELHYLDLKPFAGQVSFVRSSLHEAGVAVVSELLRQCAGGTPGGTLVPSTFAVAGGMDSSVLSEQAPADPGLI